MATTGTDGKDTLVGGTGNDTLLGYQGDDTYIYRLGEGTDTVSDAGGIDTLLLGDPGHRFNGSLEVYRGTGGTDLVFDFGSAGKLVLQNQFAAGISSPATRIEFFSLEDEPGLKLAIANGLKGTAKNDFIVGKASADSISGGVGADWIFGGAGNDTLNGDDGDDELHGGAGHDLLSGGAGDDLFESGAGNDTLNGGDGHDEATYLGQDAGIFLNLSGVTQTFNARSVASGAVYEKAGGTLDTLNSVESVEGTRFADMVAFGDLGSHLSVQLGKGNDTVTGTLGGAGNGAINVGYWDDPNGVIVNLSDTALTVKVGDFLYNVAGRSARDGWGGTDTFQFTDSQQIFIGDSDHDDYIRGRDDVGNQGPWEWFTTGMGNDTIDGGVGGSDTMSYSAWDKSNVGAIVNLSNKAITVGGVTVRAGTARDNWGGTDTLLNMENIVGSNMADYVLGSDGDNDIQGGAGKDTLLGGAGNDSIQGDDGNDLIVGGAGADNMTGGVGNDIFKFGSLADFTDGSGSLNLDFISDFVRGEDRVDLSAIDLNPNLPGKQGFMFLDAVPAAFTPGQIWVQGGVVMLNTNGDAAPEYRLFVNVAGQGALSASDFIL